MPNNKIYASIKSNILHKDISKPFFTDGKDTYSWADAKLMVTFIINILNESKITQGDFICCDTTKSFENYCLILASYLSGIAFVPVDLANANKEVFSNLPINIKTIFNAKQEGDKKFANINEILLPAFKDIAHESKNISVMFADEISDSHNAYVLLSSGSTGTPKVIPIQRSNLHSYIKAVFAFSDVADSKVFSQLAELSFDLSIHELFCSFTSGGCLVPMHAGLAGFAAKYISQLHIDNIICVPSFLSKMLEKDFICPDVKNLFLLGESLRSDIAVAGIKCFPKAKIFNYYGPTECTIAVTYHQITQEDCKYNIIPLGRAMPECLITIDEQEEILIGGPQVFNGYLGNNLNPFTIIEGKKFYKSGDIGEYKNDEILFKGRKDFQIKFCGYRVELEGIEAILGASFGGHFGAVPHNELSLGNFKNIAVFYNSPNFIIKDGIAILPKHLQNISFKQVAELPLTKNGKLDRKKLLEFLE